MRSFRQRRAPALAQPNSAPSIGLGAERDAATAPQASAPAQARQRLLVSCWWRDDPRPSPEARASFRVARSASVPLITALAGMTPHDAAMRLADGHHLYVGWFNEQPVAYGWAATRCAAIGEIDCQFTVPLGERYLWDFATLPTWRGQGFYPRLLQAMLDAEGDEAARFWIASLPENKASAHGMAKAGFRPAGCVVDTSQQLRFYADATDARGHFGAALLGMPLGEDERALHHARGQARDMRRQGLAHVASNHAGEKAASPS